MAHKILKCTKKKSFEKSEMKIEKKKNSEIREFGNLEIRKIRKRIRKIGNSETNSEIERILKKCSENLI